MVLVLSFIDVMNHIDRFVGIEPALHPRYKSHRSEERRVGKEGSHLEIIKAIKNDPTLRSSSMGKN